MALPEERIRFGPTERALASAQPAASGRVSWGGIWSGWLLALGTLLLLSVLGLAVGISAVDTGPEGSARGLGVGAGVWEGLSLLISLFFGAMAATRLGLIGDRGVAALHGALVWVLATLGLIYLAVSGVSLGAGALFGVLSGVASSLGAAVSGAGGLTSLTSGDVDQILARLNEPRTAETIAAATGMSAEEARAALSDLRGRVEAARSDPARAVAEAREGVRALAARAGERATQAAETAKSYATTTSWITLAVMVLSLLAAIGGALLGRVRAATWVPSR